MDLFSKSMGSPLGPRMVVNGRLVDYYCGTSYYTLHGDPRVIKAACEALQKYGLGPATVMDNPPLNEVAARAAEFFHVEKVQYFISGYLSDLILVQALRNDYDIILVDEISHYSVFDGIRSTGKRFITFHHLDPDDLKVKLRKYVQPGEVPLVISDGVFPITGAIAPLPDYVDILTEYDNALICIDDSHAVGVIGEKGRGTFEYWGLEKGRQRYFTGTFSKAFGGLGGFIPGDYSLMEKIHHNARVPVGASPPSSAAAAASAMGLKILSEHPEMRKQLWANALYVRHGLRDLGVQTDEIPIPIISIQIPSVDLRHVQSELDKKDIVVAYIAPRGYSDAPAVESLKISIFSTHTRDQLDRLLNALGKLL